MRYIATLYRNDDQDAWLPYPDPDAQVAGTVNFGWLETVFYGPAEGESLWTLDEVMANIAIDAEARWLDVMEQEPDLEWGIGVRPLDERAPQPN